MKYVLTGAAGNATRPLAKKLFENGHDVTVIGRNQNHLKELHNGGVNIAIGSVEDVGFLRKAFAGADAVYTMFPPDLTNTDLIGFYETLAGNYAQAITYCGIKHIVNLSSVGAHASEGVGHVRALNKAEAILNRLIDINIVHLRPVYFYTNLYAFMDMIKGMGIIGSNFSIPHNKFPVVHPADIADVAANELLGLSFSSKGVRYIASDETGTDELARALGHAVGMPDLKWVKFPDEQVFEGLTQSGVPEQTARLFVEGFNAMHTGKIWEDYWANHPSKLGAVKVKDFAAEFGRTF